MLNSLKKLLKTPIQVLPFISYTGEGDKTLDDAVDVFCYPVYEFKIVTDEKGRQVVSNIQLYINGSVTIFEADEIVFDSVQYSIKAINAYNNSAGAKDLWVIYI